MIDIGKQISYWRNGADEDWAVAQELIGHGKSRHALFIAHLALEKALKAHVCRSTGQLAPRIHNLVRLSEIASLKLSDQQIDLLADVNEFNIEGRYPEMLLPPPSPAEADDYMAKIAEVLQWLNNQF
ncbi:HEPN domain-containing protein [Geobacter sp. DSM 9736]|uniref:HEPN domain-containing protein n=1 Tax=Geobacter sp. DSM 9736 TaxID=1277350 RepID=UPI000B507979|nr:HEPN domain-containing protein [Geobacter sp. DSM 9736]SNB44640.1 HEPN domain-containing protein [Geobacter sp. DSM 9736]